jgi:hypothetical protein
MRYTLSRQEGGGEEEEVVVVVAEEAEDGRGDDKGSCGGGGGAGIRRTDPEGEVGRKGRARGADLPIFEVGQPY